MSIAIRTTIQAEDQFESLSNRLSWRGRRLLGRLRSELMEDLRSGKHGIPSPSLPMLFVIHKRALLFAWIRVELGQFRVVRYHLRLTPNPKQNLGSVQIPLPERVATSKSAIDTQNVLKKRLSPKGARLLDIYFARACARILTPGRSVFRSSIGSNIFVIHVDGVLFVWFALKRNESANVAMILDIRLRT